MTVTVVVPTWRRAVWLGRCLCALERQTRPADEVIVVGRAEDAEAQAAVRATAERRVLPVRWADVDRPGHVAPVRRGLAAATGEIVAFLDDDAEPEPAWVEALLEPFADPGVACVGGRVVSHGFQGVVKPDAGRVRWYGRHIGNVGALEAPGPIEVDAVMECNWAWRRRVLLGLELDGALDFDDASMYGLDMCLQASERGWRIVYHPGARIVHHVAPRDPTLDRADRPSRTYAYTRNYTYLGLKHFRGFRRLVFLVWWWLAGERGAYGLVKFLADLMTRRDGVWEYWRAARRGRGEGVRLWLSRCRAPSPFGSDRGSRGLGATTSRGRL